MPVSSGGEAGVSLVFFRFFLRGIKESRHLTRGSPPARGLAPWPLPAHNPSMSHKPNPVRGRLNSWFLAAAEKPMHREYGKRKLRIFGSLPPLIVELGPGSGANFRYYPCGTRVIAVEPNPMMLKRMYRQADRHGVEIDLRHAGAEGMEVESESADLVVSTLVLCSVRDPVRVLAEVRRVLTPGGRFAFDVFQPRLERLCLDEEPEEEDLRFRHGDEEVVRHARVTRDRAAQLLNVAMRYERWRGGRVVANEETHFQMRWFHRFELEHLMARAGFDGVRIYGDFDRSPVGLDSPAFVVVASAGS